MVSTKKDYIEKMENDKSFPQHTDYHNELIYTTKDGYKVSTHLTAEASSMFFHEKLVEKVDNKTVFYQLTCCIKNGSGAGGHGGSLGVDENTGYIQAYPLQDVTVTLMVGILDNSVSPSVISNIEVLDYYVVNLDTSYSEKYVPLELKLASNNGKISTEYYNQKSNWDATSSDSITINPYTGISLYVKPEDGYVIDSATYKIGETGDSNTISNVTQYDIFDGNTKTSNKFFYLGYIMPEKVTDTIYVYLTTSKDEGEAAGTKCKVTYDLQGGTMSSATNVEVEQSKAIGTLPTPKKDGYKFAGWTADKVKVTATTTVPKQASWTITANWTPYTYNIEYVANGGTGTSMVKNAGLSTGNPVKLSKNTYSKTGNSFIGWATTADATEAEYTDEQTVSLVPKTDKATIKLYAVWGAISYKVKLSAGDGFTVSPSEIKVKYNKKFEEATDLEGEVV